MAKGKGAGGFAKSKFRGKSTEHKWTIKGGKVKVASEAQRRFLFANKLPLTMVKGKSRKRFNT